MAHETMRAMLIMLLLVSLSSIVAADQQVDVFVTTTGACFDDSQVIVSVLDVDNMVMWQQNATLQGSFPTQSIYRATLGPLPPSVNINISAVAYGNSPCLAWGTAETTNITSGQINPPPLPLVVNMEIDVSYDFNLIAPENESVQNNDTHFEWNMTFEHTPVFNLVVDNNSDFSSPELNRTGITITNYTLNQSEQLRNGQYYWYVSAYNQSNNAFIQTAGNNTFNVSDGTVQVYSILPEPTQWFNSSSTTLSFQTTGNATCRYSTTPGQNYTLMTQMASTDGTTHSTSVPLSAEGGNNIYMKCNSTAGMISNEYMHTINRDTVMPTAGTVTINDGDSYTLNSTLNVTWTNYTDSLSGISGYLYGFSYYTRVFTNQTTVTMTGAEEGTELVYVWPVDRAGNVGDYARDAIIVDMAYPEITLESITNLNKYTDTDLVLEVVAQDSSPLQGNAPRVRYQKWNQSMSGWDNMTLEVGSTYSYTIPQAPDSWLDHINESVFIEVIATDVHGRETYYNITEIINDVTTPPVIDPIGTYTVNQDEEISFNITITDPDHDNILFSLNHTAATITEHNNSIATFSWTPTADDVGSNQFTISVDDGIFVINQSFTVYVMNVNDPPQFGTEGPVDYQAYVYTTFNATFNATDADHDNLTFSTNDTLWPVSKTGEIRAFPTDDMRGMHHVNLTVRDDEGELDWLLLRINVLYCGDSECTDSFESCSNCERDCGTCGDAESAAIIIYPRNCLEETMTIKAVRLVERATCDTQGLIVDGMEVCGNLSDQEIYLERVINNTYEEVSTFITDEDGIVTFTPVESGEYRITLANYEIETYFTSKQCIEDNESEPTVPATVVTREGSVAKKVERPEEVKVPEQETPAIVFWLIYVVIPVLVIILACVLAKFFYDLQVRRMKKGKLGRSRYVELIDRQLLTRWYKLRKWFADRILGNDTIVMIIKKTEDLMIKIKGTKSKGAGVITKLKASGIIPKPKPRLYDIKYFDVPNLSDSRLKELVAISVARFMVDKVKTKTIIKTIIDSLTNIKHTEMADLAYALTASGLKVEYRDMTNYRKGQPEVEKIKNAMRHGAKFKKMSYTLDELKKLMKDKAAAIVEIIAKDESGQFKPMVFPVVGYDKENIIVHDYYKGIKQRKIVNHIFEKAWKNARYKAIIVQR